MLAMVVPDERGEEGEEEEEGEEGLTPALIRLQQQQLL